MWISQSDPTIFLHAIIPKNTISDQLHEHVSNKERLREGFSDN